MQDLAYRSFVTNAIEDSVKSINAGIKTLSKLRTSTSPRTTLSQFLWVQCIVLG